MSLLLLSFWHCSTEGFLLVPTQHLTTSRVSFWLRGTQSPRIQPDQVLKSTIHLVPFIHCIGRWGSKEKVWAAILLDSIYLSQQMYFLMEAPPCDHLFLNYNFFLFFKIFKLKLVLRLELCLLHSRLKLIVRLANNICKHYAHAWAWKFK